MNLATTIVVITLSALFLWGYTQLQTSEREEQVIHATIDGVADLQTAFYRWVATRPQDATEYAAPTLAEVQVFVENFWPRNPLTGECSNGTSPTAAACWALGSCSVSGPSNDGACQAAGGTWTGPSWRMVAGAVQQMAPGTFVVSGVPHRGGEAIGLRWEAGGNEVEMHLLGRWDPLQVARLQGVLPYVQQETIAPDFGGPVPGAIAVRIDMIHPGSSASLSSAVRRFGRGIPDEDDRGLAEGMQTPLVFAENAVVTHNELCGDSGALAVGTDGRPMGCMDVDANLTREWTPIVATSVYCRQTSALPGTAEYRRNMPGALPVIEVTREDYTAERRLTRTIRVLGVWDYDVSGGTCSIPIHTTLADCRTAGGIWTATPIPGTERIICPDGFDAVSGLSLIDPPECEVEVNASGQIVP